MLYLEGRIEVSECIDVLKTSASKECIISCYWYLLDKGFNFQLDFCNGCHDVLMMSMNLKDIAFLSILAFEFISGISKSQAVSLLQNDNLRKESGSL